MRINKKEKIKHILYMHIQNNKKEYFIIAIMFIIGIFFGVLFVNNINQENAEQISTYLNENITKMKEVKTIDYIEMLKTSMLGNAKLVLIMWVLATTIIGIPILFGVVVYKGFCLGYTIGVSILTLGTFKGIIFILTSLLLQNIIFIPTIIALGVSGFKVYKSIVKDRRKENLKIEIVRHTIFSLIMLSLLMISSIIEVFVSSNILMLITKYL